MKTNKENMIVPFTTATTNVELPLIDKGLQESYDISYDPHTMKPVIIDDKSIASYPLYAMNYAANALPIMNNKLRSGGLSVDATTSVATTINMVTEVMKSRLAYLVNTAAFYTKYFFVDILSNLPKLYPHIVQIKGDYAVDPNIASRFNDSYVRSAAEIDAQFSYCNTYIMNMVCESIPLDANNSPVMNDESIIRNIVVAAYSKLSVRLFEIVSNLLKDTYPMVYNEVCAALSESLQVGQINMTNAIITFLKEFDATKNGAAIFGNPSAVENTSIPYPVIRDSLMTFDNVLDAIDVALNNKENK